MMRFIKIINLVFVLLLVAESSFGQGNTSIKVFFLYGSKPAAGYKKTEKKEFGGLHGGHVSLGLDSTVVSFHHVNGYHIFPRHSHRKGIYEIVKMQDFAKDTATEKYTTFVIPLDSIQYADLQRLISGYLVKTPYDYAFFGMRCAAAAYEMLNTACIFKHTKRFATIRSNFYPKLLRRKCFKLANRNHYQILEQPGRKSRKWEQD